MIRYAVFALLILWIASCEREADGVESPWVKLSGSTMGTTYSITVQATDAEKLKRSVDSILLAFNEEVSTYIPSSTISECNNSLDSFWVFPVKQPHFTRNILKAEELYHLTDGYFDPTVMPLVNHWGFGYKERPQSIDTSKVLIDSLLSMVGLNRWSIGRFGDSMLLVKPKAGAQLDFSASAKGDGVDLVAHHLEDVAKAKNYLVEIGGEVYAKGISPKQKPWVLGINRPKEDAQRTDFIQKISLSGKALATSGNYRNFFKQEGMTYSHTINPKTGKVERNELLSASIISDDCLHADALATACMTMGVEKAIQMISSWEGTDIFLVYRSQDSLVTFASPGFEEYIIEEK